MDGQTCLVSLDGIHCPIREPAPFSTKWYSHKFHGPGVTYEVGLNIRTGNIVWAYGGYPCGEFPDLKLARQLYTTCVDLNEKTIADDTYKDATYFIYPSGNPESRRQQKLIMSRHETVNSRLKSFNVLNSSFRHKLTKHPLCFHAVVNLTQLMILNGSPLFQINN